jgi:hypothetical protein
VALATAEAWVAAASASEAVNYSLFHGLAVKCENPHRRELVGPRFGEPEVKAAEIGAARAGDAVSGSLLRRLPEQS